MDGSPLSYKKRLYAAITSGQTATLLVKDSADNQSLAKFLNFDNELDPTTGVEGKTYFAFDGDTPVVSQGPGYYAASQARDWDVSFRSMKFVTAGTDQILLIEIRSDQDISGSTLISA